jgi:hypothetical protein
MLAWYVMRSGAGVSACQPVLPIQPPTIRIEFSQTGDENYKE